MTEWDIVLVIIALTGLIGTVVGPVVKLAKAVTKLTILVDKLEKNFDDQRKRSITSHQKLWDHNAEQDDRLNDHETRIRILEEAE